MLGRAKRSCYKQSGKWLWALGAWVEPQMHPQCMPVVLKCPGRFSAAPLDQKMNPNSMKPPSTALLSR